MNTPISTLEDFVMKTIGYKGLVKSSDFISGTALAQTVQLRRGHFIDEYPDWFHFILNGEELLVSVKPIKYQLSWNDLYQAGVVYSDTEGPGLLGIPHYESRDQNVFIDIAGDRYKVTLLKGLGCDSHELNPSNYDNDHHYYNPSSTRHSEWNQLMYRVHNGLRTSDAYVAYTDLDAPYGDWEQFNNYELNVDFNQPPNIYQGEGLEPNLFGAGSWCQEGGRINNNHYNRRIVRGFLGMTHIDIFAKENRSPCFGWRPALRKI